MSPEWILFEFHFCFSTTTSKGKVFICLEFVTFVKMLHFFIDLQFLVLLNFVAFCSGKGPFLLESFFFFCSWSGWCSSPWWLNYDVMMWWWCHTLFYFLFLLTCFWSAGQVCVCTEPVIWFSFSLIYCCSSFRTFLFCLEVNKPANLLEFLQFALRVIVRFVTRILSEFIFRILLWNKCNHSDTKFFVLH